MPTSAFSKNATKIKITLVGCGNMGRAMLREWLKQFGENVTINIIKPSPLPDDLKDDPRINYAANPTDLKSDIQKSDIIIFATKPQVMNKVCKEWKDKGVILPDTPIAHICAGIKLKFFEHYFGKNGQYIRIMPNTPASIGQGISGMYKNSKVTPDNKELIERLMNATGETVSVNNETLMDSVTATSGSGPGYFFYFAEYAAKKLEMDINDVRALLIKAGQSLRDNKPLQDGEKLTELLSKFQEHMIDGATKIDLPLDTAERLVKQTIIGAIALMEAAPDTPVSTLRKKVTSEGGTTEAALDIMMDDKGDLLEDESRISDAMKAAKIRGEELSKEALKHLPPQTEENIKSDRNLTNGS